MITLSDKSHQEASEGRGDEFPRIVRLDKVSYLYTMIF